MSIIIFASFFALILLGGLWFNDVRLPPEGRAERKRWSHSLKRGSDSQVVAPLAILPQEGLPL